MSQDEPNLLAQQAAESLAANERRIEHQLERIKALEAAGRLADARVARETLAAMTETRDALRLRLRVTLGDGGRRAGSG